MTLNFSCGWITKKGDREENQDAYFTTELHDYRIIPVWAVFDG
jgi:hypothetical protein